nr:hypothetical protein BaRGS_027400 [Batillaria attramentaria]
MDVTLLLNEENTGPYLMALMKRWTFQAIGNALVSVDTFFVLSGLLVAYLSLKEMKKREGKLNWFLFYFHRFWSSTVLGLVSSGIFLLITAIVPGVITMRDHIAPTILPSTLAGNETKQVWAFSVSWVVIACVTGNGGFVNTILSWPALIPLSRLTYCIYLLHIMMMELYLYNADKPFYMNDLNVIDCMHLALALTCDYIGLNQKAMPACIVYVLTVVGFVLARLNVSLQAAVSCVEPERDLDSRAIVAIVICSIILAMMVVANLGPYFTEANKRWTFQAISNATVSVDTFFVLSGLLVAYLSLKEMKKRSGKMNWFLFYFHRFWRLTPAYMLLMMFYVCVFLYMGKGPFWPETVADIGFCFVNTILSWSALIPLSRLTYCIYLLHIMVIFFFVYSMDMVFYYSDINVFKQSL